MAADQNDYDLFLSYARKDNKPIPDSYPLGWVAAIRDHILDDHRQFSTAPLRIFFDTQEIKDADDWRHRILGALRHSKMLLVCLSPSYFASEPCRWEWEEYVNRQVHQLMGSESVATVYFVEVPSSAEQANAKRLDELMRGNFTDLRPWFPEGVEALQKEEVRQRMARLGETLWERLQRARRAMDVPGNLRWMNPHFIGRTEEMRKLHEHLGIGAVGVVTAVHGLGGQGKTELAVAYAHSFADSYSAGLWSLAAEGETELLPLIGKLAWERALGFTPSEAEKADPALLGRGVLDHLKQRADAVKDRDTDRGAACLLLLDNVSEPALLSPPQLATLPGGLGSGWLRIVATTRLDVSAQKDRLAVLAVDALDLDSALSLLRDHQPFRDAHGRPVTDPEQSVPKGVPTFAGNAEENAAREIVRALGGFTLAVEQVALYLGLHPDVTPTAFLATLTARGLPVADELVRRDADVAAQMLTQSKQLALILDATLTRLDAPARTALAYAALLPPDTVPWPWLRALTVAEHPELREKDDLGADPWLAVQRRLTGLRLLTRGDSPEIARIHRLVAAHMAMLSDGESVSTGLHNESTSDIRITPTGSEQAGGMSGRNSFPSFGQPNDPRLLRPNALDTHLCKRAAALCQNQYKETEWELDALLAAIPARIKLSGNDTFSKGSTYFTGKMTAYRSLPAAATALAYSVVSRIANSDPENPDWQRALAEASDKLGDIAVVQRDIARASKYFTESMTIRERLLADKPTDPTSSRDFSVSLNKLGNIAMRESAFDMALRCFTRSRDIRASLAVGDPSNAASQRDLAVSHYKLYEIARALGDEVMAEVELRACLAVLVGMKQRGQHFDPQLAKVFALIRQKYGE